MRWAYLSAQTGDIVEARRYAGRSGREADVQQAPVPEYRYEVDIFWSEEDECFIACVPDLENCAAWGMTYEEALARGHEAIRADLRSRRAAGEPIPEPAPQLLADRWPASNGR